MSDCCRRSVPASARTADSSREGGSTGRRGSRAGSHRPRPAPGGDGAPAPAPTAPCERRKSDRDEDQPAEGFWRERHRREPPKGPLTCGFLRVPQYTINALAVERGSLAWEPTVCDSPTSIASPGSRATRRWVRSSTPVPTGRSSSASVHAAARAVRAGFEEVDEHGVRAVRRGADLWNGRGDPDVRERSGAARRPTCLPTPCTSRTGSSTATPRPRPASSAGTSRR